MSPLVAAAWFTETPWPPVVLLSVLAALAVAGWLGTQRGMYLVAVGVIAAACGAVILVERLVVTEAEIVEQRVRDLADAFRTKDLERTLSFFSATAVPERFAITGAILVVTVHDDLTITDMDVELTAAGSRATSHFRANASVDGIGYAAQGRRPSRWRLTWQKEGADWKVVRIEQLDPVNGAPLDLWRRFALMP